MRNAVFVVAAFVTGALQAQASEPMDTAWPRSNPHHRAFFCASHFTAVGGNAPPAGYADAADNAMAELFDRGFTHAQLVHELRVRARCWELLPGAAPVIELAPAGRKRTD